MLFVRFYFIGLYKLYAFIVFEVDILISCRLPFNSSPNAKRGSGPGTEARLPFCLKQSVTLVFVIYAISDLVFSIGLASPCSIRDVLTHAVSGLGTDGKQRHLVYMKRASFISPSAAARPDPWLQPRSRISLPMGDGLHGIEVKVSNERHHQNIQVSTDKDRF